MLWIFLLDRVLRACVALQEFALDSSPRDGFFCLRRIRWRETIAREMQRYYVLSVLFLSRLERMPAKWRRREG
jgi:hypothetical protein